MVGFVLMMFGVFYLEFLDYYSASPLTTSWIGSLAEAIACAGGKKPDSQIKEKI